MKNLTINVGDYVRTKSGEIGKLVNAEVYYVLGQNDKDKFSCVLFNNSYIPCIVSNDFIIKKGSLIDLIEVGDYVNGEKIIKTSIDHCGRKILIYGYDNGDRQVAITIYKEDIKSIVTHEQMEAMEYKVGEIIWNYGLEPKIE